MLDMQISIYHMTDHLNSKWACMNRVVHFIQNTCIKVIVTWSFILMDTFSSLNVYWRMHRAWLACFLYKQEALFHCYFQSSFTCHLLWYLNDKSHVNGIFAWRAHVLILAYSLRLFFHSPWNYTYKNNS